MNNVKKMVISALLVAVGVVLPQLLHAIPNAGMVLLPMHIPVLLCGIVCGWQYGFACGILTPLLSSLITGMPPMAILPSMQVELGVYGLVSGLVMRLFRSRNHSVGIYVSLVVAMVFGRIVFGVMNALIFNAGSYTMEMWLASSFITPWIGIIIQIVLVPAIVLGLKKSKLIL